MNARDPGLQPQRTQLAWSRTVLAMAANGLLVLRGGMVTESRPLAASGVVLIAVSFGLMHLARTRLTQLASDQPAYATPKLILAVSGSALFAALCGMWSVLV